MEELVHSPRMFRIHLGSLNYIIGIGDFGDKARELPHAGPAPQRDAQGLPFRIRTITF
jgi:hypothetical protein